MLASVLATAVLAYGYAWSAQFAGGGKLWERVAAKEAACAEPRR
jgi:hypothetical protein